MKYTCNCEDEDYRQNCSQECDLCTFGHTHTGPCDCIECTDTSEE